MTTTPDTIASERTEMDANQQPATEQVPNSSPFVVDEAAEAARTTAAERDPAELVIKGRNVAVPEHFRAYVSDKLTRLERFDSSIYLFGIELQHEPNRRQAKSCQRVELTATGKGPVVRAEACAENFHAALELAINKLEARLRRSHDRRTVHHGRHTPVSVAEATAGLAKLEVEGEHADALATVDDGPGRIVRTKEHPAVPMSVDDALYEMELVGHDFFLFQCADTNQPSVVYRRHAFDYGVIRLV